MKRRWFQIHLSTALVMMLVAAALMGVSFWYVQNSPQWVTAAYFEYRCGWPIYSHKKTPEFYTPLVVPNGVPLVGSGDRERLFDTWDYDENSFALVFNVGINLLVVLMSGAVLEVVIRRAEKAKKT